LNDHGAAAAVDFEKNLPLETINDYAGGRCSNYLASRQIFLQNC
jgi:hypothetical protein